MASVGSLWWPFGLPWAAECQLSVEPRFVPPHPPTYPGDCGVHGEDTKRGKILLTRLVTPKGSADKGYKYPPFQIGLSRAFHIHVDDFVSFLIYVYICITSWNMTELYCNMRIIYDTSSRRRGLPEKSHGL